MQAVRETVRCSRCGCISLPDATTCPKCGTAYNGIIKKGLVDPLSYLSDLNPAIENANTKVIRAYYQITCPRHGKVHIRTAVIGSTIKCPLCP